MDIDRVAPTSNAAEPSAKSLRKQTIAQLISAIALAVVTACGHPLKEQSKALSDAKSIKLSLAHSQIATIAPPPNTKPRAGGRAGNGRVR